MQRTALHKSKQVTLAMYHHYFQGASSCFYTCCSRDCQASSCSSSKVSDAGVMHQTCRLQMDTATIDRPSTANRSQGRTAMTVLQPREDLIPARLMASINHSMEQQQQQQQQQQEQQQQQAQQHPDNLRVTFGGSSNVGEALDLALADVMEAMGQEQDDMPIVSLKVRKLAAPTS